MGCLSLLPRPLPLVFGLWTLGCPFPSSQHGFDLFFREFLEAPRFHLVRQRHPTDGDPFDAEHPVSHSLAHPLDLVLPPLPQDDPEPGVPLSTPALDDGNGSREGQPVFQFNTAPELFERP